MYVQRDRLSYDIGIIVRAAALATSVERMIFRDMNIEGTTEPLRICLPSGRPHVVLMRH